MITSTDTVSVKPRRFAERAAGITGSVIDSSTRLLQAQGTAVILEDDPYRLLRYRGDDVPSIRSLAPRDVCVVGVSTVSKIIAPCASAG